MAEILRIGEFERQRALQRRRGGPRVNRRLVGLMLVVVCSLAFLGLLGYALHWALGFFSGGAGAFRVG